MALLQLILILAIGTRNLLTIKALVAQRTLLLLASGAEVAELARVARAHSCFMLVEAVGTYRGDTVCAIVILRARITGRLSGLARVTTRGAHGLDTLVAEG